MSDGFVDGTCEPKCVAAQLYIYRNVFLVIHEKSFLLLAVSSVPYLSEVSFSVDDFAAFLCEELCVLHHIIELSFFLGISLHFLQIVIIKEPHFPELHAQAQGTPCQP